MYSKLDGTLLGKINILNLSHNIKYKCDLLISFEINYFYFICNITIDYIKIKRNYLILNFGKKKDLTKLNKGKRKTLFLFVSGSRADKNNKQTETNAIGAAAEGGAAAAPPASRRSLARSPSP
ncbi:hypothetical protein MSG28_011164 [Choristoneura fumiferana]|uniref:Uncharacterized protein n=1 Tax=Choristoneura fumiferana TaxID=7141 RepID=A0ACC0KR50_CHOFU|nr:hypothetical protein MSG28_011164 [Choristoneura fumiferana]